MRILNPCLRLGLWAYITGCLHSPLGMAKEILLDQLEASVNSSMILTSDIRQFRKTWPLRAQWDPLFGMSPLAQQGAQAKKSDIIDFLINERLIANEYPATNGEVEQDINSIQATNHMDRATLKSALNTQGFQFEDYFELIRSTSSKRQLIDRDIRTRIAITDDDVKNEYFAKHASNAKNARLFHLKWITLTLANYKSSAAAYQFAQDALKELKTGESFEEVAKRFSDDDSGPTGGDLGIIAEDHLSQLLAPVKELKSGSFSAILGGPQVGKYLILKLVDTSVDNVHQLEQMKESIRNQLAASEFGRQVGLWLEKERQRAFIHHAGESTVKEVNQAPRTDSGRSDKPVK
jgi:peptidyl-prolyl cis-trans isomerase SurA